MGALGRALFVSGLTTVQETMLSAFSRTQRVTFITVVYLIGLLDLAFPAYRERGYSERDWFWSIDGPIDWGNTIHLFVLAVTFWFGLWWCAITFTLKIWLRIVYGLMILALAFALFAFASYQSR